MTKWYPGPVIGATNSYEMPVALSGKPHAGQHRLRKLLMVFVQHCWKQLHAAHNMRSRAIPQLRYRRLTVGPSVMLAKSLWTPLRCSSVIVHLAKRNSFVWSRCGQSRRRLDKANQNDDMAHVFEEKRRLGSAARTRLGPCCCAVLSRFGSSARADAGAGLLSKFPHPHVGSPQMWPYVIFTPMRFHHNSIWRRVRAGNTHRPL